jgi:hypothetical protein
MSSIITNDFRIANLAALQESLADTTNNGYYLCMGRSIAWSNDNSPPTPVDSISTFNSLWDTLIAGKRVDNTNCRQAILLRQWTTGKYYDMFRPDYDGTVAGVNIDTGAPTAPATLFDANYYIVDPTTLNVYKCLYNRSQTTNLPVASTVLPTTTSTAPQSTSDGYVWKFMFTVPSGDAASFDTPSFIPAPDTDLLGVSDVDGALRAIVVTAAGAYSVAPTVVIHGDGTSAAATAHLGGGGVVWIEITNPGSGYTHANISFTGGTGAGGTVATAIIGPKGGHAHAPADELGGIYLIIAQTFAGAESGYMPTDNDFRQIAILKNPTLSATVIRQAHVRLMGSLQLQTAATPSDVFTIGGQITGGTSGSKGIVVDYDSTSHIIYYVVDYVGFGTADIVPFQNNEVVTDTTSSNSATTNSSGGVIAPDVDPRTGTILYLENRRPVARDPSQTEDIRTVIEF